MKIININGNMCLFSNKKYNKNEIIHKLTGFISKKPSKISIEISKNEHITDEFGQYMNHSFSPNCKIENGCIISLDNINKNEELTFNYNDNETNMACPFIDNKTKISVYGKSKLKN
jgi:hypothetical protein